VGYVVMPEHIHLLITEPEVGTPSTVMQVLKQRTAHALLPKRRRADGRQRRLFDDGAVPRAFWQARFYDFNVWTTKKRVEKLRYTHRNPVQRGQAELPEQWRWSSYRFYLVDAAGPVRGNEGGGRFHLQCRRRKKPRAVGGMDTRPFDKLRAGSRTKREDWAPTFIGAFGEVKNLGHPPGRRTPVPQSARSSRDPGAADRAGEYGFEQGRCRRGQGCVTYDIRESLTFNGVPGNLLCKELCVKVLLSLEGSGSQL
jgi:REP element-mobilizing transposase RayT